MPEVESAPQEAAPSADPQPAVEVAAPELPEAVARPGKAGGGQIDILLDTTMSVSACLGEAELPVRELLQLGPGAVVKLQRQVGQPVDLYLRGIKFATGNLVVVGDQLGVRIKDILPPAPEKTA
jgi:flagellar motor switch protein FliN